jgi:hypothetical protein
VQSTGLAGYVQVGAASPAPAAAAAVPAVAAVASAPGQRQAATGGDTAPKGHGMQLAYEPEVNRTVVEVFERKSGEKVTQFPPERLMEYIDHITTDNSLIDTTV